MFKVSMVCQFPYSVGRVPSIPFKLLRIANVRFLNLPYSVGKVPEIPSVVGSESERIRRSVAVARLRGSVPVRAV